MSLTSTHIVQAEAWGWIWRRLDQSIGELSELGYGKVPIGGERKALDELLGTIEVLRVVCGQPKLLAQTKTLCNL